MASFNTHTKILPSFDRFYEKKRKSERMPFSLHVLKVFCPIKVLWASTSMIITHLCCSLFKYRRFYVLEDTLLDSRVLGQSCTAVNAQCLLLCDTLSHPSFKKICKLNNYIYSHVSKGNHIRLSFPLTLQAYTVFQNI